jgi:hypothetical protein
VQRSSVHDDLANEWLSATHTTALGVGVGLRVLIAGLVSVTLPTSVHLRTDFLPGELGTNVRFTLRLGLRAGVVF